MIEEVRRARAQAETGLVTAYDDLSGRKTAEGQVCLSLSARAYTSRCFDAVYAAHARRLGYRPVFSVLFDPRWPGVQVFTTPADEPAARAIIDELEQAARTEADQLCLHPLLGSSGALVCVLPAGHERAGHVFRSATGSEVRDRHELD